MIGAVESLRPACHRCGLVECTCGDAHFEMGYFLSAVDDFLSGGCDRDRLARVFGEVKKFFPSAFYGNTYERTRRARQELEDEIAADAKGTT